MGHKKERRWSMGKTAMKENDTNQKATLNFIEENIELA